MWVEGPRKSPAVGNCRFYDASEGFSPGHGLQRKQGFLKGKVETASSAMHAAFLPYKAPKSTKTRPYIHSVLWNLAGLCVPGWRPVKASIYMCCGLHATAHMLHRSYPLLPVARACTVLTWWNVLTGHLGLKWRLYRFQDFYGFCGATEKQLGAVSEFLLLPLLPEWWQFCRTFVEAENGYESCGWSRIFRAWLWMIWLEVPTRRRGG